jgi:hypothetical protein
MAIKVEKWETRDGRSYKTENEAIIHELELEVEDTINQYLQGSMYEGGFTSVAELASFLVHNDALADLVYIVRSNEKYNNLLMTPFEERKCSLCGKF